MFNNMKLAVKIGGGFCIILILTVVITGISINGLMNISGSINRSEIANSIVDNTRTAMVAGKNFVITKDITYVSTVALKMEENNKLARDLQPKVIDPDNKQRLDEIISGCSDYAVYFKKYADLETDKTTLITEASAYNVKLEELIKKLDSNFNKTEYSQRLTIYLCKIRIEAYKHLLYQKTIYIQNEEKIITEIKLYTASIIGNNKTTAVNALLEEITNTAMSYYEKSAQYDKKLTEQLQAQASAVEASTKAITHAGELKNSGSGLIIRTENITRSIVLICSIISILAGIVLAFFLTKNITDSMNKGVVFAEKISTGDLTAKTGINQKDEIGTLAAALDSMRDKLKTIVEDVNSAATLVSSGSQQLSNTSQQISQGATEQAASAEEISSSMEEMTSNIKQNAENALTTEKIAQKSAQAAEEGGRAVSATVSAMKEIASKIGIIEEIARSTNMLALNASIEAARAGEYGKGFAVVASEVGKLAERSQKEAGEIAKLSKESVSIAEHAGITITAMIPDIKRTAELVQEISAASNEQNAGADQINSAIIQLDKVVQQNASASEESASMSEELASQAEQMQNTMRFFKIDLSVIEESKCSTTSSFPKKQNQNFITQQKTTRLPVKGINVILDEDTKISSRNSIDPDFQEF